MCVKWLDFTGINFLPSLEGTVVPVESWAELLAKLSHFDTSKNMGIFATLLIKKIKAIVQ
jgi:hypothetical protein